MRRVAAYVPDLMDRSKVAAALQDDEVVFARTPEELTGAGEGRAPDLAIVDLSRPGVLEAVSALAGAGVRTVGFLSHVDREGASRARAAGCTEVLARSAFFGDLGRI